MRKLLRDTTILAPFDGIVVEKHTALGEQVTGGFVASKVVTIVRTSPMRISLTVPQQHIASISPGQKVHFQVDSFPGKTFEGKVKYISPVVTNDTRSMVVEALTSNEDGLLRPGLFVTADLELPERQTHIFVPAESVQKVGEAARVFVVHGKDVREQVVALGKEDGKRIEIVSGLEENELVVRNPEQLREGAVVKK
jgi:RND family efflux transporter MFP subunit